MSDKSYAVFQKSLSGHPTLSVLEKYCFDARTRGASDKTKVKISAGYEYCTLTVDIPEADATTAYAAPSPKFSPVKGGIPTWVWLFVLVFAIVAGLFV